ncbi:hypothetical protein FSP39_002675 [Pinctada imbricata]|uniref:G-protein coupled receptors family 1 profile domain-containing protein n=1 Tax=Pinctada imbricata TaxID=66713 RepID=A0AA89C2T8_PINIB|nr:hypothetical protein FSP39_002675 [Pinctada imbricata]
MDIENTTGSLLVSDLESLQLESTRISFAIRQFIMPFICFCGLVGNTLSVVVFSRPSLRTHSCSLLLAARAISDNGFLFTVFIVWLDFVNVCVFHTEGICQIVLYLSYTCAFLSVWCVVLVTAENYIRMCHPHNVSQLCTTKRATYSIVAGVILSLLVYNFPLWGAKVATFNGHTYCLTKMKYLQLEIALTYIDTLLTLIVPLVLILSFMSMIIYSSLEARRRLMRLTNQRTALLSETTRRTDSPHSKVTKLLSTVTCIFLVLHTPSHVIRIKVIVESLFGQIADTSETDRILQQLFQVLYYMNFTVNIFIYLSCGDNFRRVFCQTLCFRRVFTESDSFQEVHENEQMRSTEIVMKELSEETLP